MGRRCISTAKMPGHVIRGQHEMVDDVLIVGSRIGVDHQIARGVVAARGAPH